jgi:hypothetical protein
MRQTVGTKALQAGRVVSNNGRGAMRRDATIKLTKADKRAARKAELDSRQGMLRDNGTP